LHSKIIPGLLPTIFSHMRERFANFRGPS
jgi:hypothetical protein